MAVDASKVIEVIKAFLLFAEKLEELVDPNDKITLDDTIIKFLRMIVDKL